MTNRKDEERVSRWLDLRPDAFGRERRRALVEVAAARSRASSHNASGRLRANAWPLAQTGVAAGSRG